MSVFLITGKFKDTMMKYIAFIFFFSALYVNAFADDVENDKLSKALADYTSTGELENCIHVRDIRSTKVIDGQNILFKVRNGKAYLNSLPSHCPRLAFEKKFSYNVYAGRLCNVDFIRVLFSSPNIIGPGCGLGKFEVFEKKQQESKS